MQLQANVLAYKMQTIHTGKVHFSKRGMALNALLTLVFL